MGSWLTVLGHTTILLGVAWIQPSVIQSTGSIHDPVSTAAITKEHQSTDQNWHNFWHNHLGTWQGSWTRYTPDGNIKETFTSTRSFTANETKTEILQHNQYRYADGHVTNKQWSYNIHDHNQRDGFAHPASVSMRGLALNNGAAAWLIPSLKPNQITPFELFLMDGDRRHSVGVLYGKNGKLIRTASIREQRGGPSTMSWTASINQQQPWHPRGQWQGEKHQIRKDLSRDATRKSFWHWKDQDQSEQSNHYLPDRIILRCPERLTPNQPFSIQVIWMLNDDALQTITARYNTNFELIGVTHQTLQPVMRAI